MKFGFGNYLISNAVYFCSIEVTEFTEVALDIFCTEKTEVPSALSQSLPDGFLCVSVA